MRLVERLEDLIIDHGEIAEEERQGTCPWSVAYAMMARPPATRSETIWPQRGPRERSTKESRIWVAWPPSSGQTATG